MKIFPLILLFVASFAANNFAQIPLERPSTLRLSIAPQKPKLVVGIVVDQMRYDYLYRYRAKYGPGGFNRLLRDGFSCENTHFNYAPTYTGPGHAAIYTGTTPAVNGIIGNDWFDREWGKNRYVTADPSVKTVGAPGKVGKHSPNALLSSTITDELRLSDNFRPKVVGICLKDRGSILPAGHIPNACYWFDDDTGRWITSSYYPDSLGLPQWVQQFNDRKLADSILAKTWTTKLPEAQYTESYANWENYEKRLSGDPNGKFPHPLAPLQKAAGKGYGILRYTPWGNSLTLDFAMTAIENMKLGDDDAPDFLCLSFSSTDYCAHQFGVHSSETEDVYLRLDEDLERLFDYLDKKLGRQNVLIFLTADHGGAETPRHLKDMNFKADVFQQSKLDSALNAQIVKAFEISGDFIRDVDNQQIWLDHAAIDRADLDEEEVESLIVNYLRTLPGVYDAFSRADLMLLPADYPFVSELRRGIHPRRSGDVIFHLDAAWHSDDTYFKTAGTTHGSPYPYDTHVPLLWYGWRIRPGETFAPVSITDIAPTLAAMLRIMEPSGTTGQIIQELMRIMGLAK